MADVSSFYKVPLVVLSCCQDCGQLDLKKGRDDLLIPFGRWPCNWEVEACQQKLTTFILWRRKGWKGWKAKRCRVGDENHTVPASTKGWKAKPASPLLTQHGWPSQWGAGPGF